MNFIVTRIFSEDNFRVDDNYEYSDDNLIEFDKNQKHDWSKTRNSFIPSKQMKVNWKC